jgi:TatD DNase family protein
MNTRVFVDSHCHLQDSRLAPTLDAVLERARNAGVIRMFCCATGPDDWDRVLGLAKLHPEIIPFLGVHPFFLDHLPSDWKSSLEALVRDNPCGIGEIGLDNDTAEAPAAFQDEVFSFQYRLAETYNRPVIAHCRKSWDTMFIHLDGLDSDRRILFHSFAGPSDKSVRLAEQGAYFSFSGSLTWPGNKRGPRAIGLIPKDRLLFETDAPDIPAFTDPPADARTLNEPANVRLVYEKAAELLSQDLDALCSDSLTNAKRFAGDLWGDK